MYLAYSRHFRPNPLRMSLRATSYQQNRSRIRVLPSALCCLQAIHDAFEQRSRVADCDPYDGMYEQHTRYGTVFNTHGLRKLHRSNRLQQAYEAARSERFEQGKKGSGR